MKKLLFSYLLFLPSISLFSQNVGIGTTTPQSRLHISSPADEALRLEASQPFVSLYSNGVYKGYFWKSPNSIEVGSAAGSNLPLTLAPDGVQRLFIQPNGNVGIGVSNPSQKLQVDGVTYLNGFVGIQHNNPNAPLSFPPVLGKKITLYPGTTGDAGLGVQGNLFQMFSDNPNADIAFGYDQSNTFFESMRIKGNGNIGIGTTSPSEKLVVAGNIKADTYKYSTPKTFYITIPSLTFVNVHTPDSFFRDLSSVYYGGSNPPVASMVAAPFYPPHGALITEIQAYFYDVSAGKDIAVGIFAAGPGGIATPVTLLSSGTPGASSANQVLSPPYPVDTQVNGFFVIAYTTPPWPGIDIRLNSVRIGYTITETQ